MADAVTKVLVAGSAALAAFAARRVIAGSWRLATGHDAPDDPESAEHGWGEALAFAAITGALVGVARLAVTRAVALRAESGD